MPEEDDATLNTIRSTLVDSDVAPAVLSRTIPALDTEDVVELAKLAWPTDVLDMASDVGMPALVGRAEELEEAVVACMLCMLLPSPWATTVAEALPVKPKT